jgi:hypothetical protein
VHKKSGPVMRDRPLERAQLAHQFGSGEGTLGKPASEPQVGSILAAALPPHYCFGCARLRTGLGKMNRTSGSPGLCLNANGKPGSG